MHNGLCGWGLFVQLLCNTGRTFARFLVALHGQVQPTTIDVEVSAGRCQIGVTQHVAEVIDGHASLLKSRTRLMPEIPELEVLQASLRTGVRPGPANRFSSAPDGIPENVRFRAEGPSSRIQSAHFQNRYEARRNRDDSSRSGLRFDGLDGQLPSLQVHILPLQ